MLNSTYTIVEALDAIDPDRAALATLLDDSDPRVQVFAGAYMIKSMPERVIPILREIQEKEDANSAHFNAYVGGGKKKKKKKKKKFFFRRSIVLLGAKLDEWFKVNL